MYQPTSSFSLCDPIGMVSVVDYRSFPNRVSVRLRERKVSHVPREYFSPRATTAGALYVHERVPKSKVEDFEVRSSSF